jgi:hypothetical protein
VVTAFTLLGDRILAIINFLITQLGGTPAA